MKKLDFAKYYDITTFAQAYDVDMYGQYEKVFICVDTHTFWLVRILEGYNEEYEKEDGAMLMERNNIEKDFKGQGIETRKQLEAVLEQDEGSNWDIHVIDSVEDAIENYLDDGFGMGFGEANR